MALHCKNAGEHALLLQSIPDHHLPWNAALWGHQNQIAPSREFWRFENWLSTAKMPESMLFCCKVYLIIVCHGMLLSEIIIIKLLHLENFGGLEIGSPLQKCWRGCSSVAKYTWSSSAMKCCSLESSNS